MATSKTAYLTPGDWKPLVANGVATATKDGRRTNYSLDYGAIDDLLARALMDSAEVDSIEQFKAEAMTIEHMVFEVLGLPNITRDKPLSVDDADWVDPVDGLTAVVKSRLRVQYNGPVQSRALDKGKILVGAEKRIELLTTTGHKLPKKVWAYAVTSVAEVVKEYSADPGVRATLKQDARKIQHNQALINAVPDAAAVLIASLDVMATSAITRRRAVYDHTIEGMSPKDVAVLDEKIASAVHQSEVDHGPELVALTTGGSPETSEDEQD